MDKKDTLKKITKLTNMFKKLEEQKQENKKHKAKILVFDIETSPIKSYHWGIWQQNINTSAIIDDWFVISWAAKWLLEDEVISGVLTSKEIKKKDDERIVKGLWQLLNEADIVVAHNGKKFDIKKINTRFFYHDMGLPSPVKVIDTLQQVRSAMKLTSNRLDFIAKFKGFEGKISTNFQLWIDCMEGKKKALKQMDKYCRKDVLELESVYLTLRPYMTSHPNIGMYVENDVTSCHTCGSDDLTLDGAYTTTYKSYDRFKCNNCGSWGASRTSNGKGNKLTTKKIKNQ